MILKALANYYERLSDDPKSDIAPLGFERKAIPFLVVLSADGNFVNFRDTRTGHGKKKDAREFLVPQGEKKAASIKANLLWDAPQYVLGVPKRDSERDKKRADQAFGAFKARINDVFPEEFTDAGIRAVRAFLNAGDFSAAFAHELWGEIAEAKANLSFILQEDTQLVSQRKAVQQQIEQQAESVEAGTQACSVSGELGIPATLHQAIKGVWGAQSTGANIVSFNLDAFRSFGKKQGHNAPVSENMVFAYTTALNHLLRKSSLQRMQVGDASTVFWAKDPCDFESGFASYLNPKKGEEAVSYEKIKGLLSAVRSGIPPAEGEIPFYVLGLAPNASRIAIRFWYNGNVREIKERVAQHFRDIEVVRAPHDPEFLSIFRLLVSTATEHKSDNIPPNLGGEVARSVLTGTSYPRTLFANAIRRCKAEQQVGFARAAIIKGFLVRANRPNNTQQKEVSVALDKTYDNIGYVLGRLFAVLERIQEQAQGGGLNKTIRDTYFGGAASSPQVTFKRLDNLSVHHLAKLRNTGKGTVWLEQLKQEVYGKIPAQGIPSVLTMEDQGRFAVGYYHQRQDFFTKKETTETKGDEK